MRQSMPVRASFGSLCPVDRYWTGTGPELDRHWKPATQKYLRCVYSGTLL